MGNTAVIGLQWGDESKGKLVDVLSESHDVVVRYNGGGNAGHTIVVDGVTHKLHHIPSGIIRGKLCVMGNGMVVHSGILDEICNLEDKGIRVEPDNLAISPRAHVTLKHQKALDGVIGRKVGAKGIGTTLRGIGPTYADKIYRTGIRFCDFLDLSDRGLEAKVNDNVGLANHVLDYYVASRVDVGEVLDELLGMREKLSPFVRRSVLGIIEKHDGGLLFEGGQGTLLGIDEGTFPFCTSSNPSRLGIYSGIGTYVDIPNVVGVLKAYNTRVGEGPFPTELFDEIGKRLGIRGKEIGTTTGRNRRCGCLDLFAADYSSRINRVDEIFLPKLDVLDEEPYISICTGYLLDGERVENFESVISILDRVKPVYETIDGWRQYTTNARTVGDLPRNARLYIERIENYLQKPIKRVGIGPERGEVVDLQ